MRRAYGHRRGRIEPGDKHLMGLVHALTGAPTVPESLSYEALVDKVRDQGPTSSCEGQGWSRCIHVRAAITGKPIVYPSAMALYQGALEIDQGRESLTLVDQGTFAKSIVVAATSRGLVAEGDYPFDPSKITARPPWGIVQRGRDAKLDLGSAYWIQSSGTDRCADLRAALTAGHPVAFGAEVDATFESGDFEEYDGPTGPALGGHCQAILGFRPGAFLVLNSWGPSWGARGGYSWFTDRYIGSDGCSDFGSMSLLPEVIE